MFSAKDDWASWIAYNGPESSEPKLPNTVLVVDDEEGVRHIVSKMLEQKGFETLHAGNGVEAVEAFFNKKDEIAAVFLDVAMPIMDGESAFWSIRKIQRDAKILLCSSYAPHELRSLFRTRENTDYIQKPFKMEELITKINRLLSQEKESFGAC